METDSALNPSDILGSYRILATLGRGGMGQVYLAEDSRLGRKVALKLLPSAFTTDAERLARFEREARATSALNHPNILTIYEVGSFDGRQFIAAEFVEGETLRQRQHLSPLKLNEILDVAIQIASALSAAHQAHIVHRDIKPENIMIRPDGYVKVVDFGLAKLTEKAQTSADTSIPTLRHVDTGVGVVMGTTAYMSPEQARGLDLDARTDIWSLGVVLYEMLSASMPFRGNTPSDLIVSILDRDPAPLVTTSLVPSELDWIIRKALRKDREERYQTARELLGDLRGVKQQVDFTAQRERSSSADSQTPLEAATTIAGTSVHPPAFPTGASPGMVTGGGDGITTTSPEPLLSAKGTFLRRVAVALALGAALVAIALAGYKFWPRAKKEAPFRTMKISRLTNSGKAIDALLSPDGKYVVYVLSDAGTQSLWLRQVSNANDTQIVPPAKVGFFGLAFSRDGNDLYYATKQMDAGTLYRVPILGGTPRKVLDRIEASISFSPDGNQFVLVRGNYPNQGESSLVIANSNGEERILVTRKPPALFAPIFFTGPAWSPDGKLIAATDYKFGEPSHVRTFAVEDGKETDLTPTPWQFASRVEWLPDMSGLLVIAGEAPGATQVWHLAYPSGIKTQITNDLNSYRSIGLASDGKRFSTVQSSGLVNIWIAPEGDAKRAVQVPTGNIGWAISSGFNLSWTPDDRILLVSNESANVDIWILEADGSNRRQLTSNAGQNSSPVMTHDGKFIVFTSTRSGSRNIWRMDADGNNARQLTSGSSDGFPSLSHDDKSIFYTSVTDGKPTIWKVSIDGGTPLQLSKKVGLAPQVSPDGKLLSYMFPDSTDSFAPPNRIAVIPIEGGEPITTFAVEVQRTAPAQSQWSPDGKSISYAVSGNVTNLWSQPLEGGSPKQITDFKDSLITSFAWSKDGKRLACTRGVLLRDAVLISEAK